MFLLPFTYLLVWFHVLYEIEENGLLLLLIIYKLVTWANLLYCSTYGNCPVSTNAGRHGTKIKLRNFSVFFKLSL